MSFKKYRDESRKEWGMEVNADVPPNLEQIRTGCLLRIADAADRFNSFITGLLNDRDRYKARAERLENQVRGLRGEITKLRKKLEEQGERNS